MKRYARTVFAAGAGLLFPAVMTLTERLGPGYWVKAAVKALAVGLIVLSYVRLFRETPREAVFLRPVRPKRALVLAVAAAMAVIWGGFLLLHASLDLGAIRASLAAKEQLTRGNCLFVFTYIILFNSFLEEALFRGLIPHAMARDDLGRVGNAFSALVFAVYHLGIVDGWFSLPVLLLCIAGLAAAGLFLQLVCDCGGTLRASWLVHGGANLAINAIGMYLMFFY